MTTPATTPASTAAGAGRARRRAKVFLRLGGLLCGCLTMGCVTAGATQPADRLFDRYEILPGGVNRPTVLSGFLLDGAVADLALVDSDETDARRLRVYGFGDRGWEPRLEATLRPGVQFVDLATIGGRDRLITYERGRLSWFDPDAATERVLVEIATSFRAQDEGGIPHLDVTRDLNGDGRDDLLVPDLEGFWISIQGSDGSFSEVVQLGPPEPFLDERVGRLDAGDGVGRGPKTYRDVGITAETLPVYLGRVHQMDYDHDGKSDLVFWNEDRFEVHRQGEDGRFAARATTFAPGVPFDSEGVYSYGFEFRDRGVLSLLLGVGAKVRRTVLHSVRDVDGDGVADLVTLTLSGRSLLRQRSVYQVHFGSATAGGTVFAPDPGTALRPRGKAGAMQPWGYSSQWLEDLDGDGQLDVLFRDVAVGIGGMMRALVGNSVPIDLELYRGADGVYPGKPTHRRRIRRFAPFAGFGNVFFPAVLVGDVNGDRRADLLVGHGPQALHVYLGVAGPGLLARRPLEVAVALPYDERHTRLVDLDRDGKQDLLVLRGPTEHSPGEPHRLTVLVAR